MPTLTNNTNQVLDLPVGKNENGSVKTEALMPGETKSIEANMDDVRVGGLVAASAITVGEEAPMVRAKSAE